VTLEPVDPQRAPIVQASILQSTMASSFHYLLALVAVSAAVSVMMNLFPSAWRDLAHSDVEL
jgi:hypothetical protein